MIGPNIVAVMMPAVLAVKVPAMNMIVTDADAGTTATVVNAAVTTAVLAVIAMIATVNVAETFVARAKYDVNLLANVADAYCACGCVGKCTSEGCCEGSEYCCDCARGGYCCTGCDRCAFGICT